MKKHATLHLFLLLFSLLLTGCFKEIIRNKVIDGIVLDTLNSPVVNRVITFYGDERGWISTAGKEVKITANTDQNGKFSVKLPFKSRIKVYWLYQHAVKNCLILEAPPLFSEGNAFTWMIFDTTNTKNLKIIVKRY